MERNEVKRERERERVSSVSFTTPFPEKRCPRGTRLSVLSLEKWKYLAILSVSLHGGAVYSPLLSKAIVLQKYKQTWVSQAALFDDNSAL